jgi:hypothetical protein
VLRQPDICRERAPSFNPSRVTDRYRFVFSDQVRNCTHFSSRLVEPPQGEMIYDIRSDGEILAWIQVQTTKLDRAPGTLWTSPFAKTTAELRPTKRRTTPALGTNPDTMGIGGGYYALIEAPVESGDEGWQAHLYRLSDARHWQLGLPEDATRAVEVVHVDAQEIWVKVNTTGTGYAYNDVTLVRQRIADLGPGD